MSVFAASTVDASAGRLRQLNAQREALEVEALAISEELNSPGLNGEAPAGIKAPLIDADGFPRADIDIFNVRSKRNRLAVINTDHKALMKELEKELATYHSLSGGGTAAITTKSASTLPIQQRVQQRSNISFAIIDEILLGSPAHSAGIEDGDELVSFGPDIVYETIDALNCIPAYVGKNVNKPIQIEVKRQSAILKLTLTPSSWGGRGLLGCHLKPK